jgi:hypothetical protein
MDDHPAEAAGLGRGMTDAETVIDCKLLNLEPWTVVNIEPSLWQEIAESRGLRAQSIE